ncbi:uncharacterized protein MONBRDRAFT_22303 [Monosiga brevicollis MX1]|uniref:Translin n=1 Tax=Monosiga brevicollis TaxID=81824 RepID=A9UQ64_MONBE|nr:uncharacterized protein MONBRDRAFT_22303 [Monosiga brevicollis MX1]EDQ92542.1 predicted protein [Monosiga brevicollis MX1]|eukprot:XP_001742304.1 hypothetical protein [Monosiga brevicollis MX1]
MASEPLFQWYEEYAEKENVRKDAIREVTKELEMIQRNMDRQLQQCHARKPTEMQDVYESVRSMFTDVKGLYARLADTLHGEEYYRYHGLWRQVTQNLVFMAALWTYLEQDRILQLEEFANLVGAKPQGEGFHVDLEDFLHGICSLPSELARLATNCVTMGDFVRPTRINAFVADVYNGFRLLNLKNDSLRKRFDSLKYDVKKTEGVIYDLSIRGLIPKE